VELDKTKQKTRWLKRIAWLVIFCHVFWSSHVYDAYAASFKGGAGSGSSFDQGQPTASVSVLEFTTQPISSAAGAVFSTQPIVAIRDRNGNTVDPATECTITLTINNNPSGGTLGGTAAMTSVAGVADFSGKGMFIDVPGELYTLQAAASAGSCGSTVDSVTSSSFDVTAATYTVQSELTYDESAGSHEIRSWLERDGALISDTSWGSGDISITIYDETGAALSGGDVASYQAVINNQIFEHSWTSPTTGDTYVGTVTIPASLEISGATLELLPNSNSPFVPSLPSPTVNPASGM